MKLVEGVASKLGIGNCAAGKILEKMAVFRLFLNIFDQKCVVFGAHSPLRIKIYIGAEGAFGNFLGFVTKSGYLKIVRRGPFGSAGDRIPDEEKT